MQCPYIPWDTVKMQHFQYNPGVTQNEICTFSGLNPLKWTGGGENNERWW